MKSPNIFHLKQYEATKNQKLLSVDVVALNVIRSGFNGVH
jgi:hypothetical protein